MAVNMTVQVTMPQMGDSVTEGTVLEWHKRPGDAVEADETLVEISTDKVDADVPAPVAGTVVKIHAGEGDTVPVGELLAEIATEEAPPDTMSETAGEGEVAPGTPAARAAAESEADQVAAQPDPEPAGASADGERPVAGDGALAAGERLVDIVAPTAGESVTEGTVLEWRKQPGDAIAADEPVVEISTDKVDMELPAPASGRLLEILAPEGEIVTPGQLLGRMAANGAAPAPEAPAVAAPAPEA